MDVKKKKLNFHSRHNAKKRIWAWTGSPVLGVDLFSESELYFINVWANFYPYPRDIQVPAVEFITSGNDVEIKAFGMEADWAPTEDVFEYDGGIDSSSIGGHLSRKDRCCGRELQVW